jgi:hypothetical protein
MWRGGLSNMQLRHGLVLFGCCLWASPAAAQEIESGWQFSASPYLWLSGLKGDVGVSEEVEPVAVDLSFFDDILSNLKFAAMGTFDARHGRFVASGDVMYISLKASDNIDIREVDFLDVELRSKTFITTATAGYRAVAQDGLSLDVLGGARVNSMTTGLDLTGPQRSFSGSKTKTWVDPIVAVRFQAPIAPNLSVRTYGDIGGFGISSHLTWQLRGELQYDVSSRWSLTGGWRHLKTDYENNGYVYDTAMDGPILGAVYQF